MKLANGLPHLQKSRVTAERNDNAHVYVCMCVSVQLLKAELEMKQHSLDHLRSLSQTLIASIKNKEVAQKLEARLENLNQRWEALRKLLEQSSTQVCITRLT